jgi:hypothetical protein
MKRPSTATMTFGHAAVACPVWLFTFWMIYQCFSNGNLWPVVALLIWVGLRLNRMNDARTEYVAWERAWNGMEAGPATQSQPRPRRARPLLGSILLVGCGLFFATQANDPVYAMALAWLILTGVIVLLVWAVLAWRKRPGRVRAAEPVRVCLKGIAMPVPSLRTAYRALPAYCARLVNPNSRRLRHNP